MYDLKFTDLGLADVQALPKNVRNALRKALLKTVRIDPEGCSKPLQGPLRDFRSFRWGRYRVIYRVFAGQQVVAVAAIGKHSSDARTDVYRRLEALASHGRLAEQLLVSLWGRK